MAKIKRILTKRPPKTPAIRIELNNGVYWQIDNHNVDKMNLPSNAALHLGLEWESRLSFSQNEAGGWTVEVKSASE